MIPEACHSASVSPRRMWRKLFPTGLGRNHKQLAVLLAALCILFIIYNRFIRSVPESMVSPRTDHQLNYSRISWADASGAQVSVDDTEAAVLSTKIRILCLIPTVKLHQESRCLAVSMTWGKRCTHLLFFSSESLDDLSHVILNVPESRTQLTAKTIAMFEYAFQRYLDDFDWFLKTDDDSYVVMENLRFLLSLHDPNKPAYLGFLVKKSAEQGFMSGGPGYAISREALKRLGEKGLRDSSICSQYGWQEDLDFGKCLENRGVHLYNTKDVLGRDTFLPLKFSHHLVGPIPLSQKHKDHVMKSARIGPHCCSQLMISFHDVTSVEMYQLEFLLYRMSVYGRHADSSKFKGFFKQEIIKTESLP